MDDFNSLYNFVSGPLVWVAFIVFIFGSFYRIYQLLALSYKKEKFIYTFISLKYSLRSIAHWIIPFAALNWRKHPVMTLTTFLFHIGLVIMPFFLSAHVILFNDAWGISWWTLPDSLADSVTLIVIGCCVVFLLRRLALKEVKYVTTPSDFVLLAIAAAPFITGFLADQQCGSYRFWLTLHILSGEIMLIAIPFTRLSHMLYAVFTRAYIGSEFGNVRHARDW